MVVVLCYDVVESTRRARLHRRLQGFLRPVQKSVFEGELPARRYSALVALVEAEIDHATDTVRLYRLCGHCEPLTELVGTAAAVPGPDEDLVIG